LPGVSIVSRPRLSQLTFAGEKKLTRLPRRSAIVAFSADEVYAIAELIRRQRGGAAVVLGALSPRTRNAQVALYQAGEVDYMVATDAIGMGLNLDVDHVAFAADRKFDGYQFRKLNPAELAQIAGRAGRATRDGTFGTTGRCPPFENEVAQALESHNFEPVKIVQWRNTDLDFSSIGALQATLATVPTEATLTRAPVAEDALVLDHAARDDEVRSVTGTQTDVERLWEVCQVPDYRKIAPATHAELAVTLYSHLQRKGAIPTDWFAQQVALADRDDGDIDTLSNRIAHIRTWTFVANRRDWLSDPEHWQGVTRGIEDKLSDALHERLTERFVDRRTSALMRRLRENAVLEPAMSKTGEVEVEGHVLGRLDGFIFVPDASSGGSEAKALQNAAQKALASEIANRATKLAEVPDRQIILAADGAIRWNGAAVGKLVAGEEPLRPRVRIIADEHLTGAPREAVEVRLDKWVKSHIERLLGPLFGLAAAADISGIARGIAFQIVEALGVLDRMRVAEEVKGLPQPDRASLRKYGVRFGAYHIYLPLLLKPAPRALAAQLWALRHDGPESAGLDDLLRLAGSGRTSSPVNRQIDGGLYRVAGYRVCGERAVRVDILERLADLIRPALAWREGATGQKPPGAIAGGGFTVVNTMTSLIGASGEDFASVLRSLGYRMERRPKPPEAPEPAAAPAEAALESAPPIEATLSDQEAELRSGETEASEIGETPGELASQEVHASEIVEIPAESIAPTELAAGPIVEFEPSPSAAPGHTESAPPPAADAAPAGETSSMAAAALPEPELIEVWRPGRPEGRRRPRGEHRHARHSSARSESGHRHPGSAESTGREIATAPSTAAEGEHPKATEQNAAETARRPHRRRRHGAEQPRHDRQGGHAARHDRHRPERREAREKAPDPNSPFAKLAALKAQLEADAKERR
jgi:ATP-dependent RNA helicase SUPV3L1/SUV3